MVCITRLLQVFRVRFFSFPLKYISMSLPRKFGMHSMDVKPCPLSKPMELFRVNRQRLKKSLCDSYPNCVVLLQGGSAVNHHATDVEYVFRQEPYFQWSFGVKEPDFYGAIHLDNGESHLFMPRLPSDYAIWMGKLLSLDDVKKMYSVDSVHYTDELDAVLTSMKPKSLLTLYGQDTDSKLFTKEAHFKGIEKYNVDNNILFNVISELRVFKTTREIEIMRHVSKISSEAHKYVLKNIKPGGCRFVGYTCICGSGNNSSVLHYGHAGFPNDKYINDGDMCLFDMGAVYMGYLSDITSSFPVNGKFSDTQKVIYNAVLDSRNLVLDSMKPGVSWVDMHDLAMKVILVKLKEFGLLKGDVNLMLKAGMGGIFMPHGLGHLVGAAVHDCGGYLPHTPPRPEESWRRCLRTARILQPDMVITVEPGCYFIDHLLDEALENPKLCEFMNADDINTMRGFGGVRIEDVVLITETGTDLLSCVPRTVKEIEEFMKK